MRLLAPDSDADVYAISCGLGLTKVGVAGDARQRLRAMQVGSPVPLELAGCYHYQSADDAYAVAADLRRQLVDRRERGGWYRVTAAEVRYAIGNRSARQAPQEAAEAREDADAAAARARWQRSERGRQQLRTRAQARRQKLRALAALLAQGYTQRAAGRELGVSERTIHRWMRLAGFEAELAKACRRYKRTLERAHGREQTRLQYKARRRLARQNPALYHELYNPATRPELRPEQLQAAVEADRRPARQDADGVPIFANTREGQAERLAYYDARKLNHLPHSLFDYNDVIAGRETPAERRAREQRNNPRRRR